MRVLIAFSWLLILGGLAIAQDKPEDRLSKLEKRVAELEKENADLKRRVEALEKKLGAAPAGPVLWQFELKSDQKGSAHFADLDGDGKPEIIFGTYYGEEHLYCVDAATGAVRWKHKSDGGPLDASVAVADLDGDGKLEVLSGDSGYGKLYCLGADGKLKGVFQLPSGTDSPPAVADLDGDGVVEVLAGSMWQRDGDGAITCFNGKTRAKVWERRFKGCVQSEPVLADLNADGVLDAIITTWRGDRKIHALNGKDGALLWEFETRGNDKSMGMYHGVAVSRTGDSLTVYAATCEGDVYALDARGKQRWHKQVGGYLFAPITIADFDGDGRDELALGSNKLHMLNAEDGSEVWSSPLAASLDRGCAPVDADGDGDLDVLYFAGCSVIARDGKSGDVTFTYDAPRKGSTYEEISCAPVIADFDGDGTLDVFFVIGQGTSTDEFKRNHGIAMAVRLKGKGTGWPTFRGNLRRTGH